MDFEGLLFRYFGAHDPAKVELAALADGMERMHVDLGLSTDPGQRFALWCMLHMLGRAPDLDVAFENEADRDAARDFMDLLAARS